MYLNAPLIFLRLIKVIRTKRPQILLSCSDYSLPPISFFASKLTKTPLVLVHRETHLESFYYFPNYNLSSKTRIFIPLKDKFNFL